MTRFAIPALAALCTLGTSARASFIMTFVQEGNNVVATGEGTLNVSAFTAAQGFIFQAEVAPTFGQGSIISLGPASDVATTQYIGTISGDSFIGFGPPYDVEYRATSGSGDVVAIIAARYIFLPNNYVSGSMLSDTATWDNATIHSLHLYYGTFIWSWGSRATADFFEVNIPAPAPAVTPEPSGTALLVMALGTIGLYAWLRRRRGAAVMAV